MILPWGGRGPFAPHARWPPTRSEIDTKGIRTPAGKAQWISGPCPYPLGHSVICLPCICWFPLVRRSSSIPHFCKHSRRRPQLEETSELLVLWLGYLPSKQMGRVRFPDNALFLDAIPARNSENNSLPTEVNLPVPVETNLTNNS